MNSTAFTTIFGPITSRRLGRSLGIDIIPRKLCTLDCIYCEVGRTDKRGFVRKEYVACETILRELEEALHLHADLDCVTFSGSGEPTLHSGLGHLLRETHLRTQLPISVITNGTLLWHEDVRTDILTADVVCPSLNAVSEDLFRRINRPHPSLSAKQVLDGLVAFREVYRGKFHLEVLFVSGLNDTDAEVESIRNACQRIRPDRIHINTVVRPPAEAWAKAVPLERLRQIGEFLGPHAEILVQPASNCTSEDRVIVRTDVLALLERRSMSINELAQSLSVDPALVKQQLLPLVSDKTVHAVLHDGEEYFAVTRDVHRI